MKKLLIALLVALMLFGFVGCSPKIPAGIGDVDDDTTDTEGDQATADDIAVLDGYLSELGHVRILGDIDHILKGEKVDDEAGVTVQSMVAGQIGFDINRTELSIPLTLTDYDFDGHRNQGDPSPEKYTRTATGTLTLILTGAATAEGTSFVATGYRVENADITLAVDDSTYIWLKLPEIKVTADSLTGIFTTKGGISRANVTVLLKNGTPTGISDVNVPKFGTATGVVTIDGKTAQI